MWWHRVYGLVLHLLTGHAPGQAALRSRARGAAGRAGACAAGAGVAAGPQVVREPSRPACLDNRSRAKFILSSAPLLDALLHSSTPGMAGQELACHFNCFPSAEGGLRGRKRRAVPPNSALLQQHSLTALSCVGQVGLGSPVPALEPGLAVGSRVHRPRPWAHHTGVRPLSIPLSSNISACRVSDHTPASKSSCRVEGCAGADS